MEPSLCVGRFLARTLKSYGIDHVFFMDAILRRSLAEMESVEIRRVLAHSEKGAAYMADGYCRIARKPTVCMAQSVGAANLAAGLQDAFLAGSGILALTGRHVAENQYRNAYQEIPHEPLFTPVTKSSVRAETPEQFARLLRQAFREASTGAPRPVHIDVAGHTGSVMDQSEGNISVVPEPEYGFIPAWRPEPDPRAIQRAAAALALARRPVIIAGIGVVTAAAKASLRAFAEKLDIPITGSLDAKALVPSGHRLTAGICGTYSHDYANRLVSEADCAIFVGSDSGDQVTNHFSLPVSGATVIQIDIDPAEPGRNFAGAIGIVADPMRALEALTEACEARSNPGWLARLAELKSEWRQFQDAAVDQDAAAIRPERLCAEIGDWLPPDAILVADTGYSSHWAGVFLDITHEGQDFIRAAGSLGWSFPASLGAKCAAPDRPVVCFTGDGGFMYHLPELETARRLGLNTITIVNNNSRLGQGLRNLQTAYGDRPTTRMGEIFEYRETDFAGIARAFGCRGITVSRREELRAALDEALDETSASDVPVVIDVKTDPHAIAPLPWPRT